jgi:hypothetical protein
MQADLLSRFEDGSTVEDLTDIDKLKMQLQLDNSRFSSRFANISVGLCEVIENYSLVGLNPLSIDDPDSVRTILELIDQANGYSLSGLAGRNPYSSDQQANVLGSKHTMWSLPER